jgi:effector-binding domain-containing protein
VEKMEIVEKKLGKRQVAYITHNGPYQEIPIMIGEIVGFLTAKGILSAKGVEWRGPPFCIYFNNPNEISVEEIMYEVGMPFAGKAEEKGRVKVKTVPEQLVLSTILKGSYSDFSHPIAFSAIAQYAYKNDYEIIGPPIETYISDPFETPESEILTEISFPVMKDRSS